MSLTSHLKDTRSPVRAFLRGRFPNTREVVRDCRSKLVGVEKILPPASAERYPYDLIGMAIDYRLRFYFKETPLHDLVAYQGMTADEMVACRLSLTSSDDRDAMMERGARMHELGDFVLEIVPLAEVDAAEILTEVPHPLREVKVVGGMLSYSGSLDDDLTREFDEICSACGKVFFLGNATVAHPNVDEFADRLRDTLADMRPVKRRLERSQEELLERYCVVLSLYEMIYRSGRVPEFLHLPTTTAPFVPTTIDDLLAVPQPHWIDDLCTLSWAFFDDNADLLGRPTILNPTFDGSAHVGGADADADADMIVDDCLVDVKLTIDSGLKKLGAWLYQLLGYTLLDYSDRYGIRNVALYMPRQRTWFRWSIEDLMEKLGGDSPLFLHGRTTSLTPH